MKWNRFTIKTKTEAEDVIICSTCGCGRRGCGDPGSSSLLQKKIKHRCL